MKKKNHSKPRPESVRSTIAGRILKSQDKKQRCKKRYMTVGFINKERIRLFKTLEMRNLVQERIL